MQLLLVTATLAICGVVVSGQQGVDPAYLRQYYQQLQQQQQQQQAQPHDGTPIFEQNSEQTQQYVNSGQQIRIKDTVAEQIRAQQQQGYVAPSVRDYQVGLLTYYTYNLDAYIVGSTTFSQQYQPQQAAYRPPAQAAPQPPRRIQQSAYQAPSTSILGKGQHKLSLQQQNEEEEYDDVS